MSEDILVPQIKDPPQSTYAAVRSTWDAMGTIGFRPGPGSGATDYSFRPTVEATVDPGVVGEVRFRVAGSGRTTRPARITRVAGDGPSLSMLLWWLNLGTGPQDIIVEARRVSGDSGGVRVLRFGGNIADTLYVGAEPGPAVGSALFTTGPAAFSVSGFFVVGAPTIISAPSVLGVPRVGEILVAHPGSWTGAPVDFLYQWELSDEEMPPPYVLVPADFVASSALFDVAAVASGPGLWAQDEVPGDDPVAILAPTSASTLVDGRQIPQVLPPVDAPLIEPTVSGARLIFTAPSNADDFVVYTEEVGAGA